MTSRRSFLASCGSGLVAGRLAGWPSWLRAGRVPGIQLFTMRAELARDFEGTLARLAQLGYREAEFAGTYGRSGARVRRVLEKVGLTAPSQHVSPDSIASGWDRTLGDAAEMGNRYVVVAWLPEERRRTLDHWRRWGERFSRAGEAARRAGLTFAYHNHDFEFEPTDKRIPLDVLLEASDPRLVAVELDLYWVTKGGQDPLAYLRRLGSRVHLVHVKDMDRTAARGMADPGEGRLDFPALLGAAVKAGVRHYFIEHDRPPDAFETARKGVSLLRRLLT